MRCKMSDCFNCLYDDCVNDNVQTYTPEQLRNKMDKSNEYSRRRRKEAREKGMCTICWKEKATHGAFCYECWIKNTKKNRKYIEKRPNYGVRKFYKETGLCYFAENRLSVERVFARNIINRFAKTPKR